MRFNYEKPDCERHIDDNLDDFDDFDFFQFLSLCST